MSSSLLSYGCPLLKKTKTNKFHFAEMVKLPNKDINDEGFFNEKDLLASNRNSRINQ